MSAHILDRWKRLLEPVDGFLICQYRGNHLKDCIELLGCQLYRYVLRKSLQLQKRIEDLRKDSGMERPVLFVELIALNEVGSVPVPPHLHRLQLRADVVIGVVSWDISDQRA